MMNDANIVATIDAVLLNTTLNLEVDIVSDDSLEIDMDDVYVVDPGQGTINYNKLINKPQINSVELKGNKSLPDIGVDTISNIELENILQ